MCVYVYMCMYMYIYIYDKGGGTACWIRRCLGKNKMKYSSACSAGVSVWKMLLQSVFQGCPWFVQIPKSIDTTLNATFVW